MYKYKFWKDVISGERDKDNDKEKDRGGGVGKLN